MVVYTVYPMKIFYKINVILVYFLLILQVSCQEKTTENLSFYETYQNQNTNAEQDTYKLPNIDLSHWKVTLPIGRPIEVAPPEILNYATNETLKPFFYNDSIKGALVFYTYPDASTANSSYSRTELREQLVPGSNSTNWKFEEGGTLKEPLRYLKCPKTQMVIITEQL